MEVDKLIDDHWKYVEEVIRTSCCADRVKLYIVEFHYKSTFKHGYKHGREDTIERS